MTEKTYDKVADDFRHRLIGLTILLGWFLVSLIWLQQSQISKPQPQSALYQVVFLLFRYIVTWKTLAIGGFIYGIYLGEVQQLKSFHYQNLFALLWFLLLVLFNKVSVAFSIFVLIGPLFVSLKTVRTGFLFLLSVFFYLGASLLSLKQTGLPFQEPFFYNLITCSSCTLAQLLQLLYETENIMAFSYGFSLVLLGMVVQRSGALTDYPFYYDQIRKYVKISFVILLVWAGLIYLGIYDLISNQHIGRLFYIMDSLLVNLLILFILVVGLISAENSKIGKKLLLLFQAAGQFWPLQVLLIFLMLKVNIVQLMSFRPLTVGLILPVVLFIVSSQVCFLLKKPYSRLVKK